VKATPELATLILFNGRIYTQDPQSPTAEAVAVNGGRIAAVGADEEILKRAGSGTRRIDLEGRAVIPGMTDAHIHFYEWALKRRHLDLTAATSLQDLLQQVRSAAGGTRPERWILGVGWNESDWPERRMPTRDDLDAAAPKHPVALWRCDMHLLAANSAALQQAGIRRTTTDPPGGLIDRDEKGRPTGILRELAIDRMRDIIGEPTEDEILMALRDGIRQAHRLGLTGVHDIRLMNDADGARALRAWQLLHLEGDLDLRCRVAIAENRLEEAIALGLKTGFGDDRLRVGHVKFFADGGMGARTAWMIDPYLDADGGMPQIDPEDLLQRSIQAEEAGLSVMVHAVGDRANREVIGVFEALAKRRRVSGNARPPAVPHRIEHVQMIDPHDLKRLADLDVALCLTPHNLVLDINLIDLSVGPRGRRAYAFRDLFDTGLVVMFSSDAPVCDPNPLLGIQAAVTRARKDGTPAGGWYPESKISVAEAVDAYTAAPGRARGVGFPCGALAPGHLADMVVLNRDIYTIPPLDIADTGVQMTVFDGRIVYRCS